MKYLIAGLGNIGAEYELTRHNIGFLVLDRLADVKQAAFESGRYADLSMVKVKGRSLYLIKPTTYMNLSGKAIAYWLTTLQIPKENLLVVVDDIALPFGKLRLRGKGSAAGHNGLAHIEATLGTTDYSRLRIGIGNDFPRGHQADYVLSNFKKEEFDQLPAILDRASEIIQSFCTIGLERTMSQFNKDESADN